MKKTITFVCTFICTVNYFAQFGDLQINLRFDNVYSEIYGQIYNINSNNNNIFDQGQLTWDKSKEGAGCLTLDKKLILTKEGHSRSHWDLPEEFKNISITNHSAKSWKSDYFKSVDIGQEFVFEESPIVEEWAKNIIS